MRNPRFFVGWLISAALMYVLFYVFHGILTNDLLKISMPKTAFLTVAGIVYLVLAFGMSVLLDATFFKKEIKSTYTRAFIAGPVVGIFLYAVAVTVGISFSAKFTMINMMVDVGWQIVEETLGILLIAFIKIIAFDPNEIEV
ncbi:MAG TPA: hypothetical protein VNZ49_16815 [Bacteroidia bacterium]|jgi:hypothetical protein|nr:hypothetical protein [Bacteroidia bacterium]